jgi:hypothetical protein
MPTATKTKAPRRFSREALSKLLSKKKVTPHRLYILMADAAGEDGLKPTRQYIYGILDGSTKQPGADYLFLIAHALECKVEDLGAVPK